MLKHLTPEKNISAQNTKDQHKNIAQEFPEGKSLALGVSPGLKPEK